MPNSSDSKKSITTAQSLFSELPEELSRYILSFLEDKQIINLARLNKAYSSLVNGLPGSAVVSASFFGKRTSQNASRLQVFYEGLRKYQPDTESKEKISRFEQRIKANTFRENVKFLSNSNLHFLINNLKDIERHNQKLLEAAAADPSFIALMRNFRQTIRTKVHVPGINLSFNLYLKYAKELLVNFKSYSVPLLFYGIIFIFLISLLALMGEKAGAILVAGITLVSLPTLIVSPDPESTGNLIQQGLNSIEVEFSRLNSEPETEGHVEIEEDNEVLAASTLRHRINFG